MKRNVQSRAPQNDSAGAQWVLFREAALHLAGELTLLQGLLALSFSLSPLFIFPPSADCLNPDPLPQPLLPSCLSETHRWI